MSDRLTINPGLRYTLNFPSTEINGQTAVFNLQTQQLEYPGTEPVRPLKKNNFGPAPRRRLPAHRQDDRQLAATGWSGSRWRASPRRSRRRRSRSCRRCRSARSTPSTPAFVLAERADASRRSGRRRPPASARACSPSTRTLGSGYVQQWNVSVQRELTTNTTFEAAYVGSIITHVGIPDTQHQSADGGPARARARRCCERVPNPYFGIDPALVVARRSDHPARAAAQAVPDLHDRQPLPQQRRHAPATTGSS